MFVCARIPVSLHAGFIGAEYACVSLKLWFVFLLLLFVHRLLVPVVSELLCPHGRGSFLWARLAVRGAQEEEQEGQEVTNARVIDSTDKLYDEIQKKPSERKKEPPLCAGKFRTSVTKKKDNFLAFFFVPPPTRFP